MHGAAPPAGPAAWRQPGTGEPCARKRASTVRGGADGTGLHPSTSPAAYSTVRVQRRPCSLPGHRPRRGPGGLDAERASGHGCRPPVLRAGHRGGGPRPGAGDHRRARLLPPCLTGDRGGGGRAPLQPVPEQPAGAGPSGHQAAIPPDARLRQLPLGIPLLPALDELRDHFRTWRTMGEVVPLAEQRGGSSNGWRNWTPSSPPRPAHSGGSTGGGAESLSPGGPSSDRTCTPAPASRRQSRRCIAACPPPVASIGASSTPLPINCCSIRTCSPTTRPRRRVGHDPPGAPVPALPRPFPYRLTFPCAGADP